MKHLVEMLLQFTVENVLSFREEAVLNLRAAPGVSHVDGQTVSVPGLGDVLRVAAVYGANASGKSNLVSALALGRRLILAGTPPGEPIAVSPFKLDRDAAASPSKIEFELFGGDRRWSYGFACTGARVHAEWLYVDEGDGEHSVFARDDQTISVDAGLSLDREQRRRWESVAEATPANQLFAAEANAHGLAELAPFVASVRDTVAWPTNDDRSRLARRLSEDAGRLHFASALLREAGTGIAGIELEGDDESNARVAFRHASTAGETTLGWDEESDGTRRLVGLSIPLHRVTTRGGTLFADELDGSLHTLLARRVVETLVHAKPSRSGQLLFTTHDTKLLDRNLLPEDSIWFVEKSDAGASALYSLADFEPEQLRHLAPDLERGYLNGRFGATPFLGEARRLGRQRKGAS